MPTAPMPRRSSTLLLACWSSNSMRRSSWLTDLAGRAELQPKRGSYNESHNGSVTIDSAVPSVIWVATVRPSPVMRTARM